MDVEKDTVVVDSGAAENVMLRSMCPAISTFSKNGNVFKGPGRGDIKNHGKQVMSVRVAVCRREKTSGVGISHHPSRERPVHLAERHTS